MKLVARHPDLRFSQILLNYRFVKQVRPVKPNPDIWHNWQDEFYLEPNEVLKRVEQALIDYKEEGI